MSDGIFGGSVSLRFFMTFVCLGLKFNIKTKYVMFFFVLIIKHGKLNYVMISIIFKKLIQLFENRRLDTIDISKY